MKVLVTREETDDPLVAIAFEGEEREAIVVEGDEARSIYYEAGLFRLEVEAHLLPKHFSEWKLVCNLSEFAFGSMDEIAAGDTSWEAIHAAQDAACPEFEGWQPELGYVYEVKVKD